ncbi:hypothetical protein EVAR_53795_1 [Eumeta japonica]|uniref:Uncharacterized protein n=1 Tax=Eumeta variegata TaxID=151549 RepID=A0A4C1XZR5_EUMVA|nr:hypothetical protein EVAR_53795_1 [Eumeta japonica]
MSPPPRRAASELTFTRRLSTPRRPVCVYNALIDSAYSDSPERIAYFSVKNGSVYNNIFSDPLMIQRDEYFNRREPIATATRQVSTGVVKAAKLKQKTATRSGTHDTACQKFSRLLELGA